MFKRIAVRIAVLAVLLVAATAQAHPGHERGSSVVAGLLHPMTGLDHLLAMVALSIPTFWLGLMAIYVFAVLLRVLPPGNLGTIGADFSVADRLRHLLLPAGTLGVVMVATWSRYTRASTPALKRRRRPTASH